MKTSTSRRAWLRTRQILPITLLLFAVIWPLSEARADQGRDFAGFYALTDVTDYGDQVELTFSLQLFNYSGIDIDTAQVTLNVWLLPTEPFTQLGTVSLQDRELQRLSSQIRIPADTYQHWLSGVSPWVEVAYQDAEGNTLLRPVELLLQPALIEE